MQSAPLSSASRLYWNGGTLGRGGNQINLACGALATRLNPYSFNDQLSLTVSILSMVFMVAVFVSVATHILKWVKR